MNNLAITIHQAILAIDEELGKGTMDDLEYRYRMVKSAYSLRNLEQWMQKNKEGKKE